MDALNSPTTGTPSGVPGANAQAANAQAANAQAGNAQATNETTAQAQAARGSNGDPGGGREGEATLLTQKPGADEPGPAGSLLERVPDDPNGYELSFEKTTEIDQELLQSFKQEAHAAGFSPRQAQAAAKFFEGRLPSILERYEADKNAQLVEHTRQWEKQIKSDPAFRQKMAQAGKALARFGSADFGAILDMTRAGSHPVMFDFMARVGAALGEPTLSGSSEKRPTAAEIIYPNHR